MPAFDPSSPVVLALVAALLLLWPLIARQRKRKATRRKALGADSTSLRFAAQAVRVLSVAEREAHTLLCQAMPGYLVLAQVPVTRFLRVETNHAQWVQQAMGLSADLLLCNSGSRVLAVVSVRSAKASENSRRRQDKLTRLLKAANVRVLSWNEDALPDMATIRTQLVPLLVGHASAGHNAGPSSRAMPLIPVAEVLAEGDSLHDDPSMEPVASALFDDMEPDLPLPKKR